MGLSGRCGTEAVSVQTPFCLLGCFWVIGLLMPPLPGHRLFQHACQQYPEAVDVLTCAGLPPAMNYHRRLFVAQTLADEVWLPCEDTCH